MRLLFVLLSLLISGQSLTAQAAEYFQQEVHYQIETRLDDEKHVLHAHLKLTYVNNSPDVLDSIAFHLWPKAYAEDETAFAQQQLRNGSTRFHFADKSSRGNLDSLRFTVDGQVTTHRFAETEIVWIVLPEGLASGASAVIETPFRVKIPASFSRLGHVGQSYQMTQWYPKPAVYDRNGWHPMPYLDQGEFFSEFGSFKVKLTLPKNYVVGATGTLLEAEERTWMLEKAAADRTALAAREDLSTGFVREPFPASATETKTITYVAEEVHDFAWFADKRFKVLHDTLDLALRQALRGPRPQDAGKVEKQGTIDVWAMFTETEAGLWKDATDYLKRATRFYSDHVGAYPYPQVTGLQSALSAGGGMEYPMITVIGRNGSAADLDEVLTHEVGHNWFYGILASNERDHPWMDEGLNSYYEQRYMNTYYPDRKLSVPIVGAIDYNRLGYLYTARQGKDQAPDTRSDSLSRMNYWIEAYSKPTLALQELENYVGTDRVDAAMQAYYRDWAFRHPGPEDFFRSMDDAISEDLSPWFAEGFMTTKTTDWRAKGKTDGQPNIVVIGPRLAPAAAPESPLDLWSDNNGRDQKLRFSFLTAQDDRASRQLFALPLAGYNTYDGIMLGAALHNRTLEPRRFEWMLAPMYGFGSGELAGFAGGRLRIPRPMAGVQQALISLGTQGFSDFTLASTDEAYAYARTALKGELIFDNPPITLRKTRLFAQLIRLRKDRPAFEGSPIPVGVREDINHFLRLGYERKVQRELTPLAYRITLEYKDRDQNRSEAFEASHLRLEGELIGGYQYERDQFLRWRFFGGTFLSNSLNESSARLPSGFSLIDNAFSDYRYDDLYTGRNADGWHEQQTGRRQGGFRAPISPSFSFGTSNKYLAALNLDADLPFQPLNIPLGVFLDAGYYGFRATSSEPLSGEFNWVGGVSLSVLEGRVGVYLPLIADPDTKMLLEQRGDLLSRLSFRIDLAGGMPWKWIDKML